MNYDLKQTLANFDFDSLSETIDGSVMVDKIEFSSNNWDGNYAGGNEGLIDIRGIHRIYF